MKFTVIYYPEFEEMVVLNDRNVVLKGDDFHDNIKSCVKGFFYALDYAYVKYERRDIVKEGSVCSDFQDF